jgi:molecular chaperone GrpE (heat shock protein)
MNKIRRSALQKLQERVTEMREELEVLMEEEEEYRDNMPENLQGSEKYEIADTACDNLSSALDALEEAVSYIESAAE